MLRRLLIILEEKESIVEKTGIQMLQYLQYLATILLVRKMYCADCYSLYKRCLNAEKHKEWSETMHDSLH